MALIWRSDFEAAWPGRNVNGLDSWAADPPSTVDLQQNNNNYNFHILTGSGNPVLPQWGASVGEFKLRPTDMLHDTRYAVLLKTRDNLNGTDYIKVQPNDEFYMATWLRIPSDSATDWPLLWQLHQIAALYNLALSNNIAPHAIVLRGGNGDSWTPRPTDGFVPPVDNTLWLAYRATVGQGDPGWHVKTWALTPIVYDRFYKLVIHFKLKDDSTGIIQVWMDDQTGTGAGVFTQGSPNIDYTGATNIWTSSVPAQYLYMNPGLYNGRNQPSGQLHAYHGGWRAYSTFAEAIAQFAATTGGDVTAPSLVDQSANGDTIVLTYNETLDGGSVPAVGDYVVTVNGAARSVTSVLVSYATVTLTLSSPVYQGDTVTLSYTQVAGRDVQDVAANSVTNFSNLAVGNATAGSVRTRTIVRVTGTRSGGTKTPGLGGGGI